ncbi:hypothetical protein LZ554_000355 [Drepanopeziza brunnea f. sp. 'monogermtubi']|nr:hypothetical protein LZ554_000355 [Drepanopeziza brunnea f. sp. 'monogermtubi']
MPVIRRWRVVALAIIFALTSIYYLNHKRNVWNYGYKPRVGHGVVPDNRVHWKKLPDRYPVKSFIPLPTGKPMKIPTVQAPAPAEDAKAKEVRLQRRDAVKESFVHSWTGYKEHAWLRDEVTPLSGSYRDTFGGWAATLVDALDTLWIMGLKEDFEIAVKAVQEIDFSSTDAADVNVFETTIRYLGGFLAAYDISGRKYPVLLAKAVEVGDLLMSCFDTPNRMPITRWDWKSYVNGLAQTAPEHMLVSEIGSLSLEFTHLSQLTGDPKYYDAVQRIGDEFEKSQNSTQFPGLWPVSINASKPSFDEDTLFTLGGMSDSLYEYFPKQFLILGGLLAQPRTLQILWRGGMVGLASKIFERPADLEVAEELTKGCVWAYDISANGIMPEVLTVVPCPKGKDSDCNWDDNKPWHAALKAKFPDLPHGTEAEKAFDAQSVIKEERLPAGFTAIDDRRYILRPEAIESVFLMYRMTGKQEYADSAWRMFQAIEKVCRTAIAAAAIRDITVPFDTQSGEENGATGEKMDSMESFWLAETLKYFYLCFEEWDVVSLDEWVLNTEAHPLRRPG